MIKPYNKFKPYTFYPSNTKFRVMQAKKKATTETIEGDSFFVDRRKQEMNCMVHFSNPTSFKLRSHNFLAASSSWAPLEGSLNAQSDRYLPLTPSISSDTAQ